MSWRRVRGHDRLIQAFANVVRRGRLAHSYLFVGPDGVGKKRFATELARVLLCEGRSLETGQLQACDRCAACLLVEAGTHPDLVVVGRPEDSNELPIEIMRELCRNFGLKSARGRGKVAVLDDADDLNEASANCFLKTLEEPPPQSVFLLIGTSRDQQLPTILSRCQVVRFAPLPDADLREVLQAHGIADPALVARVLRLAGGSPGQALALADPELWRFRGNFLDALTTAPMQPAATAKMWLEFVESAGKELAQQRRRAGRALRLLVGFVSDALTLALGGVPRLDDAEELSRLQAFIPRRSPERLTELIERCLDADAQIRRYIQLALVLEGLMDAFCD
jgi:DNA polymerase-3 subunit delta'